MKMNTYVNFDGMCAEAFRFTSSISAEQSAC